MTLIPFVNKGLIALAVVGAGLFLPTGAIAAAGAAAAPAAFHLTAISFPSDPPGIVRSAPGGGRVLTPALLYTPASGANPLGPALVILDQGPGSHPLEAGQATRFAAERLAAQGYTVLSLYSGQERGYSLTPFKDTAWALRGALDYLEVMGHERFALLGQGYGAIAVANYLSTQPDVLIDNGGEKRVKAVVLLNPLTELRNYPRSDLGERYEALLAKAEASVASGRGTYPAGRTLEPGHGAGALYDPWLLNGPYIAPAEGFLDYWGPKAAERNALLLTQLALPTLVMAGQRDNTVSLEKLRALKTSAALDLKVYPSGDARWTALEQTATADIAAWLARQDLAPAPKVLMQALDVTAANDRLLQGIRYAPGDARLAKLARSRPTVLLLHGRTGDTLQSSTHWMGWRLAQQGFEVIAPGLRISGGAGIQASTLAEVSDDIGRWIVASHAKRVVLAGHSNGGIWLSNYLSLHAKDRRVVGTIFYAPTRDGPAWERDGAEAAQYAAKVKDAQEAVARGDGLRTTIGLLSAQAFLDFSGPASRATHTDRVKDYSLPGIAFIGARDPLMSADFVELFKRNYAGALTLVRYENGSHGFRESKDRLIADTRDWLLREFNGPTR